MRVFFVLRIGNNRRVLSGVPYTRHWKCLVPFLLCTLQLVHNGYHDRWFGYGRLGGCNCYILQIVTELHISNHVDDA